MSKSMEQKCENVVSAFVFNSTYKTHFQQPFRFQFPQIQSAGGQGQTMVGHIELLLIK